MVISVSKFREYYNTSETDSVLEDKLQALELLIRSYTNNNFQVRPIRSLGTFEDGKIYIDHPALFKNGDTVQISETEYNAGLLVISDMVDGYFECDCIDEIDVLVTKVVYPKDVQIGVVNMLKWDLANRDKVGVQSETISRHSVTYFNMDGDNSIIGFPKSLVGFLKPYIKARF